MQLTKQYVCRLDCKPEINIIPKNTTTTTTVAPPNPGLVSSYLSIYLSIYLYLSRPNHEHPNTMDTQSIIGLIIWFLCVLYSSVGSSSATSASKLTGTDQVLLNRDDGAGRDIYLYLSVYLSIYIYLSICLFFCLRPVEP